MKILIVDDEPGVARLLADGVGEAAGGECFVAENAEDAVEIVNREGGVDVLVTGVFMEGVDGFTLHETLRPYLPDLLVIFLSDRDIPSNANRANGWPVLPSHIEPGALFFAITHLTPPPEVVPEPEPEPDPLVGLTLGNYRIDNVLGTDLDGNYYHAVQTNIQRAVELHALDPARVADPAAVERFLMDARTKANVHHPALLSVFEAGQHDGIYFYTSEVRSGSSLAAIAAREQPLEPRVLMQLLHSVAEVMVHLSHEKIAHEPLRPEHVLIDHRMRTRLVNTAVSQPSGLSAVQEMQSLAAVIAPVVAPSDSSQALQQLLFEMQSESVTLRSWNALLYEVKRCASGAPSPHSHRLDASGHAAIEAVGIARKKQRMTRQLITLAVILIPLCAGGFWAWKTFQPKFMPVLPETNVALETMQKIPAGEFVFGGQKITLPDFWIDTHEVTIGQYADFLAWMNAHPGEAPALLEGMPDGHSYVPAGWVDETGDDGVVKPGYHAIARAGGIYDGVKLTLDSPVFGVDWFDASAYAKWKGHRLPTSEEWEKAALGTEGKKYPWGDEWKLGNANIAAEDGFKKWSPVNALAGDRSPYGVIGMAGNVSEWTAAPRGPGAGKFNPVARGGNWSDAMLNLQRVQNLDASQSAPTLGFRTATDKPPQNETHP